GVAVDQRLVQLLREAQRRVVSDSAYGRDRHRYAFTQERLADAAVGIAGGWVHSRVTAVQYGECDAGAPQGGSELVGGEHNGLARRIGEDQGGDAGLVETTVTGVVQDMRPESLKVVQ